MTKHLIFGLLCALLPALLSAQEVKLLTSIKPLQLIAAAIQKDIAHPDVLLPVGASAHHYSLRPQDIQRIQTADLFYWIGPDMEIFLSKTVKNRVKPTITVQQLSDLHLRHFSEVKKQNDSHDHDHQPGNIDPHLWLDINNARIIAKQMAADLSALDPQNKQLYQKNLNEFIESLLALDKAIQHRLNNVVLKPFFVLHETYDYFEAAYDLKHTGVFSLNSAIQPSIKQLMVMKQILSQQGASCIFYEPPVEPKLVTQLAENLPVQIYELDAMGADVEVVPNGYLILLNNLTKQLLQCKNS